MPERQSEESPQSAPPSEQDEAKARKVAKAAADAARAAPDPASAARDGGRAATEEAERLGITEEQLQGMLPQLADAIGEHMLEGFANRGVFEPPPEPVQRPPHVVASPPVAEPPSQAQTAPEPRPRRTFAHRFMGIE